MGIYKYIRKGNIKKLSRLMNQGIDINCRNEFNYTPLMEAVKNADIKLDMLEFLVENGAEINAMGGTDESTIIDLAIQAGNIDKIQFLLDAGVDINYRISNNSDILINAMNGRDIKQDKNLIPILKLLIERGAELDVVNNYEESALQLASHNARFDAVQLLLDAGANKELLGFSELMEAIVFGSLEDVRILLEKGADLYHFDCCDRNAFYLSLELGDLEKAKLILPLTPSSDDSSFWIDSPLFYAVTFNHSHIIEWLITEGFEVEATNAIYLYTPLMFAAHYDATDCVRILLEAGANPTYKTKSGISVISEANNLEIIKMLHAQGSNLSDINNEMQVLLRGCIGNKKLQLDEIEIKDKSQKLTRFGTSNPEIIQNKFWQVMVCNNAGAYIARSDSDSQDIPIWCYQRFGKTITILPDGRIVEIAGEHEDFYDPDFCIYNDIVVSDGKGNFQIYGYPEEVFPPTDFHTATFVDNYIYIIGNLGYRVHTNETQVYRLNCDTFQIEKIETTGDKPGWISRHQAKLQSPSQIYISGGEIWTKIDGEVNHTENSFNYILDLTSYEWSQIR